MQPPIIAVIGAMTQEIRLLEEQMSEKHYETVAHISITRGILENKTLILALSGIGKVNAAITTTVLIEKYQPDCIINTGSAGGLSENMKIGNVVIGTQIAHHDVDATAFGYELGQVPHLQTYFDSNEGLIERAYTAAEAALDDTSIHRGLIVSGDQFINQTNAIEHICTSFNGALACEMEAAAIAQTCVQFGLPFVIIRSISDLANEEADITFEEFLKKASKNAAQIVQNIVRDL